MKVGPVFGFRVIHFRPLRRPPLCRGAYWTLLSAQFPCRAGCWALLSAQYPPPPGENLRPIRALRRRAAPGRTQTYSCKRYCYFFPIQASPGGASLDLQTICRCSGMGYQGLIPCAGAGWTADGPTSAPAPNAPASRLRNLPFQPWRAQLRVDTRAVVVVTER